MEKRFSTLGDVPNDRKMTVREFFLVSLSYAIIISTVLILFTKGFV